MSHVQVDTIAPVFFNSESMARATTSRGASSASSWYDHKTASIAKTNLLLLLATPRNESVLLGDGRGRSDSTGNPCLDSCSCSISHRDAVAAGNIWIGCVAIDFASTTRAQCHNFGGKDLHFMGL